MKFHLHNWKRLYFKERYEFDGELIFRDEMSDFRICVKCGTVQSDTTHVIGGRKYDLAPNETEVIMNKIDSGYYSTK